MYWIKNNILGKVAALLVMTVLVCGANAAEPAQIVKYHGKVKVYEANDLRGAWVREVNHPVQYGGVVKTKRNSHAVVVFNSGDRVVLSEKAVLKVEDEGIALEEGRILFNVEKKSLRGLAISTPLATIGVKGTRFLIDSDAQSLDVYLAEGVIEVKSKGQDFKRVRQSDKGAGQGMTFDEYANQFNLFESASDELFAEYAKKQQQEFVEYVRQFDMQAGESIRITGNLVEDIKNPSSIKSEYEQLSGLDTGSQ